MAVRRVRKPAKPRRSSSAARPKRRSGSIGSACNARGRCIEVGRLAIRVLQRPNERQWTAQLEVKPPGVRNAHILDFATGTTPNDAYVALSDRLESESPALSRTLEGAIKDRKINFASYGAKMLRS